jgi:hypothetical protein
MHQNYHFIVMLSQTLLHVSAYQRHHQGAHMILTSQLYVGVHYRKNHEISRKLSPFSIFTLWIQVVMTNCCWKQWAIVEHGPRCPVAVNHFHLYPWYNNTNWSYFTRYSILPIMHTDTQVAVRII